MAQAIRYRHGLGNQIVQHFGLRSSDLPAWVVDAIAEFFDETNFFDFTYYTDRKNCTERKQCCVLKERPFFVSGGRKSDTTLELELVGFYLKIDGTLQTQLNKSVRDKLVECTPPECADEQDALQLETKINTRLVLELHFDLDLFPEMKPETNHFGSLHAVRETMNTNPHIHTGAQELAKFTLEMNDEQLLDDVFTLTCQGVRIENPTGVPVPPAGQTPSNSSSLGSPTQVGGSSGSGASSPGGGAAFPKNSCHLRAFVDAIKQTAGTRDPTISYEFDFRVNGVNYSKSGYFDANGDFHVTSHPDDEKIFDVVITNGCGTAQTFDFSVVGTKRTSRPNWGGAQEKWSGQCTAAGNDQAANPKMKLITGEEIEFIVRFELKCV